MKRIQFSLILVLSFVAFVFMACSTKPSASGGGSTEDGGGTGGGGNGALFKVDIEGLKPIEATFTVTPPSNSVTYALGVMTKKKYEAEKAKGDAKNPPEGIFSHDCSWYKVLAGSGGDWKKIAKEQGYYKTGEFSDSMLAGKYVSYDDIRPESDCVVYCYLINETSEKPDSEVFVHEFKTPAQQPSEINLSAKITKAYINGVEADITASNEDPYVVCFAGKKFFDWYATGDGHQKGFTTKDAAYKLLGDFVTGNVPFPTFSGSRKITPSDVRGPHGEGNEAYLVIFAFDTENGVRSEVKYSLFTTTNVEP